MKITKKLIVLILVCVLCSINFTGCNSKQSVKKVVKEQKTSEFKNEFPNYILEETEKTITYIDPTGEKTTVTKKPKRVVVLLNSILDLWYMSGGKAVGRCSGTTNVPEQAKNIEILGRFSSISTEKLLALKPDLVILSSPVSSQRELKKVLVDNNIEYAYVNVSVNPYDSFIKNLYLFSKITGNEDIYYKDITKIKNNVSNIINKVKDAKKPSVIILFASTKYVKCELPISLTGDMVQRLGAKNIAADASIEGATKVDFSLEKVIERDPDYILITTMGDVDKCKARVKEDIESNDAWNSLTAVKEGRVYYLPKNLYLYKPNARYAEAFEGLAKILYPEVYNK